MFKLFSLSNRQLFALLFTIIALNVNILATNESNDNQISEQSDQLSDNSDFSEIDIIDSENAISDTIEPSDDNQTLALLSTDADASAGSANETGAETSVQVNATHETKVNCTPVNIDVATNQVRHHLASVWNR